MDGRGFFLGLIAAVVLFLLWKKESGPSMSFSFPGLGPQPASGDTGTGGCAGCSGPGGCAGCNQATPAYAAAPTAQAGLVAATAGQITPGTPPLQTVHGGGSFYASSGPTPDNSFTNIPAARPVSTVATVARTQTTVHNVAGSPSTPATIVPTRAVAQVPSYPSQGFQQRFNVAGVPQRVLSTATQYRAYRLAAARPV